MLETILNISLVVWTVLFFIGLVIMSFDMVGARIIDTDRKLHALSVYAVILVWLTVFNIALTYFVQAN
jgi:uncharacterized membrane protein